jgi:hypothetical protein
LKLKRSQPSLVVVVRVRATIQVTVDDRNSRSINSRSVLDAPLWLCRSFEQKGVEAVELSTVIWGINIHMNEGRWQG